MPSTATKADLDYIRLCERCYVPSDGRWLCGVTRPGPCSRCPSDQAFQVLLPEANEPRLEGNYAWPEFTTSVSVTPHRYSRIVWDVNLYYRDLGVSPYATKAELREAYAIRDGSESARLTFVLKQLLNDEVRERYDATPLGQIFFDDEVAAEVRRRIAEEVAQSRLVAPDDGQPTVEIDLSHLMDRGFDFGIDKQAKSEQSEERTVKAADWGWYRWASPGVHQYRLSRWRALLAKSFSSRGDVRKLSIGLHNRPEPWIVREIGYRTVIFLAVDLEPDSELTDRIAEALNPLKGT